MKREQPAHLIARWIAEEEQRLPSYPAPGQECTWRGVGSCSERALPARRVCGRHAARLDTLGAEHRAAARRARPEQRS